MLNRLLARDVNRPQVSVPRDSHRRSPRPGLHTTILLGFGVLLLLPALGVQAQQAKQAGSITALKPQDFIIRGQQTTEAKKGDAVQWKDIIRTERGGRVRLTLTDGSVLNIGSETQVEVVQHDATTQQTQLELGFGKARAVVRELTQPDSRFEVRTKSAVAGVVGTDVFLDSSPTVTIVICLNGVVLVRSSDPNIPGVVWLYPGEATSVEPGGSPQPKRFATPEEIQAALDGTAVAPDLSLALAGFYQGSVVETAIMGENLVPAGALTVSGEGVTMELLEGAAPERVPVRVTVAGDAQPGIYTFTLVTPGGPVSGELFVIPRPSFFLQLIPELSPESPLEFAPGGGSPPLQVTAQPLEDFSGTVDLALLGLPEGVTPILAATTVEAGQPIDLAFAAAADAAPGDYTLALVGSTAQFATAATLYLRLLPAEAEPESQVQAIHIISPFEPPETLTGTTFRVLQGDRLILDASATTGVAGDQGSFAWQILNTSLRSTQARFEIDTWLLDPGTYRILLAVGFLGGSTRQEFRLVVGALPDPDEVLFGLQQAYETLQINQYLSHFDPLRFRGYPALEESIRNFFQSLSEARVYLRIDNRQLRGEEATYQAVFEISFREQEQPDLEQRRIESVTLRLLLLRSRAGAEWKITDFAVVVTEDPSGTISTGVTPGGIPGGGAPANPAVSLQKTAGAAADGTVLTVLAGADVTYSYRVTNTGDTELINIDVSDDRLGTVGTIPSLAPGAVGVLTSSTILTADTVNVGTVRATPASGGVLPGLAEIVASDDAEVDVVAPAVALVKTVGDAPDETILAVLAGSEVTYSYQVTNTGDTELTDVQVSDDHLGVVGTIPSLAPGGVQTLTATTTITADVTNVATVTATPARSGVSLGVGQVSAQDDAVVDAFTPGIALVKTAGGAADGAVLAVATGTEVTYNYQVTNTGDTELIDVQVSDDRLGAVGTISSLAPGGVQTLTASAAITVSVTNVATVTATPARDGVSLGVEDVSAQDDAVVEVFAASVALVKTAGQAPDGAVETVAAGTSVTYSYQVTNSGETDLENIMVTDDQLGSVGTIASLAPGATQTLTASAVINQTTLNVGTVTATASRNGVSLGFQVTDTDDAEVEVVVPRISLIKLAGDAPAGTPLTVSPGARVIYTYELTNTGDTELINISVTDDQLGLVGTIALLAPGASSTLNATTTISASVTNQATASGLPARNGVALGLAPISAQASAQVQVTLGRLFEVAAFNGSAPGNPNSFTSPLTANLGGQATVTVGVSGFTGSRITISFSNLAPDVTASPPSATVVLASNALVPFIFTVSPTARRGLLQGQINFSGGGFTTSMPLLFNIVDGGAAGFDLAHDSTAANPAIAVVQSNRNFALLAEGRKDLIVSVTPANNFAGTVTLSFTGLPGGLFVSPASVTLEFPVSAAAAAALVGGKALTTPNFETAVFSFFTDGGDFAPGDYTPTLVATAGRAAVTTTVFVRVPSFFFLQTTFDSFSNPVVVPAGGSANLSVDVIGDTGFNGMVKVDLLNFSSTACVDQQLSPLSQTVQVTGGGTATVTFGLTASSAAAIGNRCALGLLASVIGGDPQTRNLPVDVVVSAAANPWYQLSSIPSASLGSPLVINRGTTATLTLSFAPTDGFTGTINWTATSSSTDVTVLPTSGSVTSFEGEGVTALIDISVSPSAQPSQGSVVVIGISASGVDNFTTATVPGFAELGVVVGDATDPTFDVVLSAGASNANPVLVTQGAESQEVKVVVRTSSGFFGTPTLQLGGLPTGVFVNITDAQASSAGTSFDDRGLSFVSNIFFTAAPTAPTGSFQATLTVLGGSTTQVVPVFLQVAASATGLFSVSPPPSGLQEGPQAPDCLEQPVPAPVGRFTAGGRRGDSAGRAGRVGEPSTNDSSGATTGTAASRCVPQTGAEAELAVRVEEIRQEPRFVQPGQPVQFRIPVHNVGSVEARNVGVEFSVPELQLRRQERVDLRPGETATVMFETRFALSDFRRRLRPEVVIDPERKFQEARRDDNRAVLEPLELERNSRSLSGPDRVPKQRAFLLLAPGECAGLDFRGGRTECGRDADLEITASSDGLSLELRAAALAPVAGTSLENIERLPEVITGTRIPLLVGQLVAVEPRFGDRVVLRLVSVRRSSALRSPESRLPREISRPGIASRPGQVGDLPAGGAAGGALPLLQLSLEWIGGP